MHGVRRFFEDFEVPFIPHNSNTSKANEMQKLVLLLYETTKRMYISFS
jgi:hypothetical protein